MTPSTRAPTDAGALAALANDIELHKPVKMKSLTGDWKDKCVIAVTERERDQIVAALRNSAPQETRGDEPVGNRSSSAPEPCSDLSINELIEWLDAPQYTNGFLDFEAANHMSAAAELLDKLYPENLPALAAPQQSPRLEREGLARCLVNNDPNYSIYHMPGDAARKVQFTSGWVRLTLELSAEEAEHVRVRADAILALLSPDTPVVSSTSQVSPGFTQCAHCWQPATCKKYGCSEPVSSKNRGAE